MTTLPNQPGPLARTLTPPEALEVLPHPLHLFEGLVGSGHYHLGWSGPRDESFRGTQERLVERVAERLPRSGTVLDVGSGLGGTIGHLAARGRRCLGIDPCESSVAYARSRFASTHAQFCVASLDGLAAHTETRATFSAVLMIESAHRLRDADALLAATRGLLRPGGSLVAADVVRGHTPFDGLVFHARGAIAERAARWGFEVVDDASRRAEVAPTLERLHAELRERAPELMQTFRGRPTTRQDIDVLTEQLALLREGMQSDILDYEVVELRRR